MKKYLEKEINATKQAIIELEASGDMRALQDAKNDLIGYEYQQSNS